MSAVDSYHIMPVRMLQIDQQGADGRLPREKQDISFLDWRETRFLQVAIFRQKGIIVRYSETMAKDECSTKEVVGIPYTNLSRKYTLEIQRILATQQCAQRRSLVVWLNSDGEEKRILRVWADSFVSLSLMISHFNMDVRGVFLTTRQAFFSQYHLMGKEFQPPNNICIRKVWPSALSPAESIALTGNLQV